MGQNTHTYTHTHQHTHKDSGGGGRETGADSWFSMCVYDGFDVQCVTFFDAFCGRGVEAYVCVCACVYVSVWKRGTLWRGLMFVSLFLPHSLSTSFCSRYLNLTHKTGAFFMFSLCTPPPLSPLSFLVHGKCCCLFIVSPRENSAYTLYKHTFCNH